MNISAVNMNAQSFGRIFRKGDKPTSIRPDAIASDVRNHEVVCIIVNGGDDWYPYTAGQWRAQKAADSAIEQMKREEAVRIAASHAIPYKTADENIPDDIRYWNY